MSSLLGLRGTLLPGRAQPWLHAAAGVYSCPECLWTRQDCQEEYACTCLHSRVPSWLHDACRGQQATLILPASTCAISDWAIPAGARLQLLWRCLHALALKVAARCLQGEGCNYFAWADELGKAAASGGGPLSSPLGSPAASQQGSAGSSGRPLS